METSTRASLNPTEPLQVDGLVGVPVDTDDHWVERLRSGDARALETLMQRHNTSVFRTVRSVLRDDARTEDIVQDTYIRALTRIDQYRGPARFRAWLLRIAVNEALGDKRRTRVRIRSQSLDDPDVEEPVDPDHGTGRHQIARDIERALDRIPAPYACVFVLRRVQGLSIRQTAYCIDIPEDTVKSRLFRAERLLRSQLCVGLYTGLDDIWRIAGERCRRIVTGTLRRSGYVGPAGTRSQV